MDEPPSRRDFAPTKFCPVIHFPILLGEMLRLLLVLACVLAASADEKSHKVSERTLLAVLWWMQ